MTEAELKEALFKTINRWAQVSYPAPATSDQDFVRGRWADQAAPQMAPPFFTLRMNAGPAKMGDDDLMRRDQLQTLVFSSDLVASNVINGSVGGTAITAVTFATSHASTMHVLCGAIKESGLVKYARVDRTDGRKINIRASADVALTGFVVTLGASQPTITNAVQQTSDGMEMSGLRRLTLGVQVFGVNRAGGVGTGALRYTAMDILQRVYGALDTPEFLEDLTQWEIGIEDATEPVNLTDVVETTFEARAQMDIFFTVPFQRLSTVGMISTATATGMGAVISGP